MNDAAGSAAAVLIKESVMGALLVVAVVLLVLLVRRVLAVQDLRVADQKQMSERLEKAQEKQSQLITSMTDALGGMRSTIGSLDKAQNASRDTTAELSSSINAMRATIDSVLREAVRAKSARPPSNYSSPSSTSGGYSVIEPRHSRGSRRED